MRDEHVVENQEAVFAFLGDPASYGIAGPVRRIDTHGAVVFLAGEDAYKVKRAVRHPFMDFSTLARRRAACEAEIAVNRPNVPEIYRGVVPITRADGRLALGGTGEVVEWAVHMRRFDETRTLDRLAEAGPFPPAWLDELAAAILAAHAAAPLREGAGAVASLARYVDQNEAAFGEAPALFPPDGVRALSAASRRALRRCRDLLLARGVAGHVRRGHGDLHLRNLVLLDGHPRLFDALEFDDAIATGDVLYDLAFLLMDLWERGRAAEANAVLNRYLFLSGDDAHLAGLAALPLFLSIRAAIRAKVVAAGLPHLAGREREVATDRARRYFSLAGQFLAPVPPRLVAVGGLSGTGKSTLAARLAPHIGRAPGAVHLRSDTERKALSGVSETTRLPDEAYTPAANEAVYARLRHKAGLVLAAGHSAVVDAVHARPAERQAIEAVAEEARAAFDGLWLEAPVAQLVARVEQRRHDASDATGAVVRRQAGLDPGAIAWTRLDTGGPLDGVVREALARLKPG